MAQAQPEESEKVQEQVHHKMKDSDHSGANANVTSFKLNVKAPEFVPRSHAHMHMMPSSSSYAGMGYYYHPCFQFMGDQHPDWFYFDQELPPSAAYFFNSSGTNSPASTPTSTPLLSPKSNSSKNVLTDDLQHKIISQVEYQFSDMSLLANESFSKQISKDSEGYVPISYIASTKKIKSLVTNNQLLTEALKASSKLVVSEDGKKVRRKHPFIEKDKEDLQSRTVVAENLPEDHSHHNLEKIFGAVGSVKTIRMCYPPESNSSRSKSEFIISNKLHALVEYESADIAEKAVEKLNDERNWRKGLRVRLLLRRSPKSILKSRKPEFDGFVDDEDSSPTGSTDDSNHQGSHEIVTEHNAEENLAVSKKGSGRGRGKGRARAQNHGRGSTTSSQQQSSGVQAETLVKQTYKGPRMPDGTKGFTMGRGKPVVHG